MDCFARGTWFRGLALAGLVVVAAALAPVAPAQDEAPPEPAAAEAPAAGAEEPAAPTVLEALDNTPVAWATALGIFLLVWLVLGVVRRVLRTRVAAMAARHANVTALQVADSVVGQTKGWFLVLVALLIASRALAPSTQELVTRVLVAGALLQLGFWGSAAITTLLTKRRVHQLASDPGSVAAMDLIGFIVRVVIWSIVLLIILDNLGVEVTTLIAGLGVGGIAVALAAQNILGDLFASLSIVLDKPFLVGDALNVGDFTGTVERIGLKTTRLRSIDGEQVVISNADLLGTRIRNFGRMADRRVLFTLGVTYQTKVEQLKAIPKLLEEIIEAERDARFDRAHFKSFGDSALNFEVVYFVKSSDFRVHVEIQQRVNVAIFERFAEQGIEFAYPTQTVQLLRADSEEDAEPDGAKRKRR